MRQHPDSWDDMSNYVVHFTKGGEREDDYSAMMGIYSSCMLKPRRRFGIGKDRAPSNTEQRAVCFSEIPPGHQNRIEDRRGTKYGLGFTKEFILSRGGGPIWYAWKDTPHWRILQEMMTSATDNADAPIWKLTPMIDAPGEYRFGEYQFDWEREWRHVGPMSFQPEDVAFLLIPETLHEAARSFFENALAENLGPAYFCPYVDPSWSRERIIAKLNEQVPNQSVEGGFRSAALPSTAANPKRLSLAVVLREREIMTDLRVLLTEVTEKDVSLHEFLIEDLRERNGHSLTRLYHDKKKVVVHEIYGKH